MTLRDVGDVELAAGDERMCTESARHCRQPTPPDSPVGVAEGQERGAAVPGPGVARCRVAPGRGDDDHLPPNQVRRGVGIQQLPGELRGAVVGAIVNRDDLPWPGEVLVHKAHQQLRQFVLGIQHRNHDSYGRIHRLVLPLRELAAPAALLCEVVIIGPRQRLGSGIGSEQRELVVIGIRPRSVHDPLR